jgi:hypothetical protein
VAQIQSPRYQHLNPCRTSLPNEEGTEAARAAEEEAHRAATAAARRLASREWAEARTPRNPPTRNLNMLDLVSYVETMRCIRIDHLECSPAGRWHRTPAEMRRMPSCRVPF